MRRRPIYGAALLLLLCCLALPPSLWIRTGIPEGTTAFTGTVGRREQREGMQVLYLKNTSIPKARWILVYLKDSDYSYFIGNILKIQGRIQNYEHPGNPGQFDSLTYYQTKKIDAFCYADRAELLEDKRDWLREALVELRLCLSHGLEQTLGESESGILKAMLLGDKGQLPLDIKRLYQRSGIAHLLAISGLHISILGAGFYKGMRKIGIPCLLAGAPALIFMACYGILTGAGVSTLRALTMFFLAVGADLVGRTYDIQTALGAAAIWLLLEQPLYARDGAFLLSFGAVFGLVEVTALLKAWTKGNGTGEWEFPEGGNESRKEGWKAVEKLRHLVTEGLWACLGIQIVTLPILLYCFYEAPVYAPFLNLLVIPLMGPLLAGGLCCMLLGVFFPAGAVPAALLCRGILEVTEFLARCFNRLPGAVFCGGCPAKWQMGAYYGGVALMLLWGKYRGGQERMWIQKKTGEQKEIQRQGRLEKFCFSSLYILCLLLLLWRHEPAFSLTMLDVGQGDAICFRTRGGSTYLMDGGSTSEKQTGEYILEPFFKYQGKSRVDYILVSHLDRDHISGILEILEEGFLEVGCLILPAASQGKTGGADRKTGELTEAADLCQALAEQDEAYGKLKKLAEEREVKIQVMGAGDSLEDGELRLYCLGPERGERYESRNAASLTICLEYKKLRVLLTGDLEGTGESRVLDRLFAQSYDILKTAHHGSGNSTKEEWLARVNPRIALISCGEKNSYGHRHEELLERLKNQGCRIYLTPRDGAVTVQSDGESYEVTKFQP